MTHQILSCGKYHAKIHCCFKLNLKKRVKKTKQPCSSADRRNDRNPRCSLATRLFCQKTCTVKGHECCSVSLGVQKLVSLNPISMFWPHFDKILATPSTITSVFLDNRITFKVTKKTTTTKKPIMADESVLVWIRMTFFHCLHSLQYRFGKPLHSF